MDKKAGETPDLSVRRDLRVCVFQLTDDCLNKITRLASQDDLLSSQRARQSVRRLRARSGVKHEEALLIGFSKNHPHQEAIDSMLATFNRDDDYTFGAALNKEQLAALNLNRRFEADNVVLVIGDKNRIGSEIERVLESIIGDQQEATRRKQELTRELSDLHDEIMADNEKGGGVSIL